MKKHWQEDPNTCKYCAFFKPEEKFKGFCSTRISTVTFDHYCEDHEIGDEFMFDKDLFNPKFIKR